jgi:hypothetical protein
LDVDAVDFKADFAEECSGELSPAIAPEEDAVTVDPVIHWEDLWSTLDHDCESPDLFSAKQLTTFLVGDDLGVSGQIHEVHY